MNTFKPLIAQTKPMSHLASLEELQSNRYHYDWNESGQSWDLVTTPIVS